MMALYGVLWEEYILFVRNFWSNTLGAMVSPVLYLIAFGWGMGEGMQVDGIDYMQFVIPGVVALNTMFVSFNNTANTINISRMYDKTFEAFMISPIKVSTYAVGKITAGAMRGLYSGLVIVLLLMVAGAGFHLTVYFILLILLNCFVFSAGGFLAGVLIDSHGDMAKFTNFVITPMSFLCGTFFPVDKMPDIIREIIYLLPLTHTSLGLRVPVTDVSQMFLHAAVLFVYMILFFGVGVMICNKAE